jgi:uncharacterized membrane protein HdeD (DUF308 family)
MSTQVSPDSPLVSPTRPAFLGLPMASVIQEDLKGIRDSWFWFVLLGAALILLGIMALSCSVTATLATALIFGCFLAVAGVCYIVGAFFTRGWGGFFLSLLGGVLYLAAGVIMIDRPLEAAILYTLIMAVFFFVDGLFRIVAAIAGHFREWGWVLFSGVVTLLLGILIWKQWPLSGLWVIGLFLGINLIMNGASYIALGLNARRIPV